MLLKRKLLLSLLLPALLIVAVSGAGLLALDHLQEAAARILADNYHTIQESRLMERALWELQAASAPEEAQTSMRRFAAALARCEANITEAGEHAVLRSLAASWARILASGGARRGPRTATAAVHTDLARLVDLNETAMRDHERKARGVGDLMHIAVVACGVAAIVALTVFALFAADRIAGPVTRVADRLHAALNRDRAVEPETGRDEISRLHAELEALLARLAQYEEEQRERLRGLRGQLALVLDEVQEGVVLLDAERQVVAINRVARTILDLRIDEPPASPIDPDVLPADVRRLLEETGRAADGSLEEPEDIPCDVGGEQRVYRPRVIPMVPLASRPQGHLLVFWDVTGERRFEESRRRFIAMLSHQLKSPLTSLSMSLHLLQERGTGRERKDRELLSIATEDCNNLSTLVSELIDAARRPSRELVLQPRRVAIVPLLRETLRPLLPQAEEKGVELVRPTSGEPLTIAIDPVKFPWVVTNIAGNALRYTKAGGRIEVEVRSVGDDLLVEIADTGRGIPAKDVAHVFEPYVTTDERRHPGTHGLGLAIAKEIVEAHDGTLSVESRLGQGTTFRIALPLGPEIA